MEKCETCGCTLKPLFTTLYCPNEQCGKPEEATDPVLSWWGVPVVPGTHALMKCPAPSCGRGCAMYSSTERMATCGKHSWGF